MTATCTARPDLVNVVDWVCSPPPLLPRFQIIYHAQIKAFSNFSLALQIYTFIYTYIESVRGILLIIITFSREAKSQTSVYRT